MSRRLPLCTQRIALLRSLIVAAVPLLNQVRRPAPWPVPLDTLRGWPPATWGSELAAFLDARGLGFLPQYEAHDAFHVLLGYDTSVEGELHLQAFMVGNGSASLAGRILYLLGCLLMPEHWAQLRCHEQRGRASARVGAWSIPALLASGPPS
jgi:hypothetical protein